MYAARVLSRRYWNSRSKLSGYAMERLVYQRWWRYHLTYSDRRSFFPFPSFRSPCSKTCGQGVTIRTRLFLGDESKREECKARKEFHQQKECTQREECSFSRNEARGKKEHFSCFSNRALLIISIRFAYRNMSSASWRRTMPWYLQSIRLRSPTKSMCSIQLRRVPRKPKQFLFLGWMSKNMSKHLTISIARILILINWVVCCEPIAQFVSKKINFFSNEFTVDRNLLSLC